MQHFPSYLPHRVRWGEYSQQAQRPESIEGPHWYAPQTVVAQDS